MELIRERLREAATAERKEQRLRAINKNRPALGEYQQNASYSTEFVKELAKALKKKTLNTKDYWCLQNALIQNESNIEAFLKVDNIIYALARDISGNNPVAQANAVACCCNLALANNKACTTLTKIVSPYLTAECESLNWPLLEVCLWTIGNLASGSQKAFDILHMQGCLKQLTQLIQECDKVILSSVIYAALHCLYGGHRSITEMEIIELAQACNKRKLAIEDSYSIWFLALLSSTKESAPFLSYCLPDLVDYLYCSVKNNCSDVTWVAASIRILANILYNSSEDVVDIFLSNMKYSPSDREALFNNLLLHPQDYIKQETLWLLGNLCNHPSANVVRTMETMICTLKL